MERFITQETGENEIKITAAAEGGECVSSGLFQVRPVRFGGRYTDMLLCGGIETKPYARRKGLVRKMLSLGEEFGRSMGAAFSILHPFSFSYYRKFGYERVSDTLIVSFPISALDFVPYFRDLKPFEPGMLADYISYYDRFSKNRNLMFKFSDNYTAPENMFVLRDGQGICGHVVIDDPKTFDGVNKMVGEGLVVRELGFLDPDSLCRILGFLRMFEGEQTRIIVKDAGPVPELDLYLKHYMDTSYELRPDIMAKVLDTEKAISLVRYREGGRRFVIEVSDEHPNVGGRFAVSISDVGTDVREAGSGEVADIKVSAQALSRLVFGCDSFTKDTAAFLPGVTVCGSSEKVLDAFPKQINGNFYHF